MDYSYEDGKHVGCVCQSDKKLNEILHELSIVNKKVEQLKNKMNTIKDSKKK